MTADVRVLRTGEAGPTLLDALHRLLVGAFDEGFAPEDWDHALGGWHVVVAADPAHPLAHAAVVPRVLHVGDRRWRAGYLEAVATDPDHRARGFGSMAVAAATEVVRAGFDLGALSTGAHPFYERLGWERWQGPTGVRTAAGLRATPEEDDGLMVLRHGPSLGIDLKATLSCEPRAGDDW